MANSQEGLRSDGTAGTAARTAGTAEETGKTLSYVELDTLMKTKMNLQGDINYRRLPAKVAQQTLMLVSQNVKSFFKAKADYIA